MFKSYNHVLDRTQTMDKYYEANHALSIGFYIQQLQDLLLCLEAED